MQILYDCSLLFRALLYEQKALNTGVYRFTYNILKSFIEDDLCEISLCSSQFFENAKQWDRLYRSAFPFGHIPYILPEKETKLFKTLSTRLSVAQTNYSTLRKFVRYYYKLERDVLNFLQYLCKPSNIDPKSLSHGTIYYSSYYPIPTSIANKKGVKYVVAVHDVIQKKHPELLQHVDQLFLAKIFKYKKANNYFITSSESLKRDICDLYSISSNQVFIVPKGADTEAFSPIEDLKKVVKVRERFDISNKNPYFFCLSTLEPKKNLQLVIKAFAKLIHQNKDREIQLVLAGPKDFKYNTAEEIEDIEVRKRVKFTGFVDDEELRALYCGALAFLYPSLHESFGVPPLEAMSCGVPVVASNTSSLPEIIGSSGIMLDPEDENMWYQTMENLIHDEKLSVRLRSHSLEQAKQFSWKNSSKALNEAFQKIASY